MLNSAPPSFTKEQLQQVVSSSRSLHEAARTLGVSDYTLQRHAKDMDIDLRSIATTSNDISREELLNVVSQVRTLSQAQEVLKVSYPKLKRLMNQYNITKKDFKKVDPAEAEQARMKKPPNERSLSFTREQMEEAVKASRTYTEVAQLLGYSITNGLRIKKYIERWGIDISHFNINRVPHRMDAQQFSRAVVDNIAQASLNWYEFMRKCGFTPGRESIDHAKRLLDDLGIDTSHFRKTSWTHDEFVEAVKRSVSIKDILRHLGLEGQNNYKTVKRYIKENDIDISHFETIFNL